MQRKEIVSHAEGAPDPLIEAVLLLMDNLARYEPHSREAVKSLKQRIYDDYNNASQVVLATPEQPK